MPKEIAPVQLHKKTSVWPPDRSWEERKVDMRMSHESRQRMELDSRGKKYVVHDLEDNNPKQIIVISDWHLGSVASDWDEMERIRDYILSNPDILVIFAGDEIEGWTGGKHSQSIDAKVDMDAQDQIEYMWQEFFAPLANAGRVIGMVSEYWGHPGWLSEKTVNIWKTMIRDLDIDIIQNGGYIGLRFLGEKKVDENGNENLGHFIKVWHNPPKGSSLDEVAGQRTVMQNTSESARPDGSVAGHIHRLQVAREIYSGAKFPVYYISSGTLKGSNPDLPNDLFGTQLGLNMAEPQGQGVQVTPKKGRRPEMAIPFVNLRQAKILNKATDMLNRVEQLGERDYWLEKIHREIEEPGFYYPERESRLGNRYKEESPAKKVVSGGEMVVNPYSKIEMKAPYSTLSMEIRTRLPFTMELVSNVRMGSTSEGFKDLRGHLREVVDNPHRSLLFLRNVIDINAGKLDNRVEVLDKFVNLINSTVSEERNVNHQTLAILMCESLRQDDWKKSTKGRKPIAPGSYLAEKTGVPMVHHLSLLKLAIGPGTGRKTIYPVVVADKAENYGSNSKPEWGLQQLYNFQIHEKPGVVVGTHMPNAGVATFFDPSNAFTPYPMLIAPGWWSGATSLSKGNVKEGAEPGQAVIFMPGKMQSDYNAFPTATMEETEYTEDALKIMVGLEIMGLTDKVMRRSRR